jgi:molybdate transport system substrate-binding protein
MATRLLMAQLASAYEREAGRKIDMRAMGGVDAAERIRAGEPLDFAVLASGAIDALTADGFLTPERFDIARSAMVAAVRAGEPHPDLGSEASLRDAILRAERIGYSTGPSGDHLLRLLNRWGVMQTVAPRLVLAPPGVPVAELLAQRQVELGFQQRSEFVDRSGIDVVAPLPAPAELVTVFSAALCATADHARDALEFLRFAISPEAAAVKLRCGMEPC